MFCHPIRFRNRRELAELRELLFCRDCPEEEAAAEINPIGFPARTEQKILAYIRETYDVDNEIHMRDRSGRRWCKCIHCGELKPTDDMPLYGGPGKEMNRGQCRLCLYYLGYIDLTKQ